ncbi:FHA domain-containing protein [Streptomyces sp. P9(2023)]|uniref:FHA domain-containing protein n=1 Tax=Streptomyces sp. P9(2023) TaxID=3064394 RepID=UPI0028F418E1|nr:FHA domain-containing protein [Streptomyces sp. P9(2023)]MDT9689342.1 FHA domain-containing protein [Streptomyces sp. P9(2023)]
MQIRLTVLAPHAGHGAGRACDVLLTAPAGTALAAVASGLAAAVSGPDTSLSGSTVLYAGRERLDARRCSLGEPPLVDGAILTLHGPGEDELPGEDPSARLHVVAGPDAGGVHLLHPGPIRIGRSLDADVPLDDPDVSRVHCTVTVGDDGRVTVADLGSTNGTTLDGTPVGDRPVPLAPGALLRLGESALRLTGPEDGGPDALPTAPDGEGHLRVELATGPDAGADTGTGAGTALDGDSPYGRGPQDAAHDGSPTHARVADLTDSGTHGEGSGEAHSRIRPAERQAAQGPRGRRGIGAWARRFAGAREDVRDPGLGGGGTDTNARGHGGHPAAGPAAPTAATWPDPAAVLLTALGPGPRLWERGADHPEALVVRLGTTDRAELSGVPVTVGLREAGSLGLAGPGARLAGLARSVVAQLAALHSPSDLEIVLISADRGRSLEERRRAWGWLGWLPHLRPAHGQDCRLLLAYDRDQAHARTAELTRRLDDGPLGPCWPSADRATVAEAAARYEGPVTVVIVDGDPGSAALRETTARLAGAGAAAGIHLLCLAEAPAASPVSPVAATYESACAASLAFRECGAVALLSGDVATALRLLRTAGGRAAGHGTVGVVDAVSVAWAERFGRALAPLRTDAPAARGRTAATALPRSARLLDELGLARATPASLLARWAAAGDGTAVLGAGPRGPVAVDLTEEGPHLLIEGPAGSGRTELLRSIAASLAAGGRPDRLGLLLVDGTGGERGEGLAACTELPHVTEHLVASDPVRMREFAQALGAELKRRAEILGDGHFADRQAAARMIGQRPPSAAESVPPGARATARIPDARTGEPSDRQSGRTLRTGDGLVGDRPGGPEDRPLRSGTGADDLTYGPSGRTARTADGSAGDGRSTRTGAEDLTYLPSGRTARGGADAGMTGRTGADDVTHQPSGRTPRTGDGSGGRSARPGGDDLTYLPSARTHRTDVGDLADHPSGRVQRLGGAEDLVERGSGRVTRSGGEPDAPRTPDPHRTAEAHRTPDGHRTADGRRASDARTWADARDEAAALPRLVVLVDDYDALVAPALGSPGRPAAGSVVRALEAVARGGARLGVHLVATSARPDRTADTELAHGARLRIVLDAPPVAAGPDDPAPGRGRLGHPDGRVTPFQAGRVTGRIPRTATLRPTVVPLEWERMGDPPTRRPVRELGNGPTDLALLASALDRAARSLDATPISPLTPATRT